MARRKGVTVGVTIDGEAKGFKSASEDAQKASKALADRSKKHGQGMQATFRKITMAMGPIALAIGAVVGAFKALSNVFSGSIVLQEKLNSVMGYLGGIMDGVKDLAIDLTKWLVKAFEDPQQAVKDLWEMIKQNFINRFQGLINMVTSGWDVISQGARGVGLAIKGIFDKEARDASKEAFAEMRDGMRDFGNAALQVVTGVEDVVNKVRNGVSKLGEGLRNRAREAQALAEREFALRRERANSLTDIATLEAKIAAARRVANDDQEELTDQIVAQERAMALVEEKFQIQERLAKEALAIQRERMALGHDSIEDIEKEKQLHADLISLQQSRDDATRTLLRRYGTLINQVEALEAAEKKAAEEALKARQGVMDKIEEYYMTDVELNDKAMRQMLDAHQWSEEEKLRITEYFADKRAEILAREQEAAEKLTMTYKEGLVQAVEEVGHSFNQMAASGRASTSELLKQILATVTGLVIKSIWASAMPFAAKIGLSAGASVLAGGIMNQIPAFASGGIVSGPVVGQMGEYAGVHRNPEVIAPLDKLKSMMGSRKITVVLEGGKIRGKDILLAAKRAIVDEEAST